MAKNSKGAKLLDELVIKVNSRALKQAVKDQDQLYNRMEDAAQGSELLNEQLQYTNIQLQEAKQLSKGLASNLEAIGSSAKTQEYFDEVIAAIQGVEGVVNDLAVAMELYAGISKESNDAVVVSLERLLDPLRKVDKQTGKTAENVGNLGKKLDDVDTTSKKASKGIEGAGRVAKNSTRAFQDLAKIAGPLPMVYATIAANVYALTAAYEQMAAGDRLNRLERINAVIGAEQGVAVSQLATIMQEATGYAIGFDNAMQKAAQASAYGFDPAQVEEFTLAARRASVALGVDLDDQLNRIIRGVSKLEVELLDELGITVRLNDAYQKYQEKLNISQTSLSGFQKQQAYANAVIAESTKRFGYLGDAIKATPWERLQAGIDQSVKSGQKWLAEFLEPAADAVAKVLEKDSLTRYQEGIDAITKAQSEAGQKGDILQVATLQQDAEIELNKALDEKKKKLKELQDQQARYARLADPMFSGQQEDQQTQLTVAIDKLNTEIKEQEDNIKRLNKESGLLKGTQDQINEQMQTMALRFREIQQLGKSMPETVSKFNQSIQTPKAPTDEINEQFKQAIEDYQYLQKLVDDADITTIGGLNAYDANVAKQQKILADQGAASIEELRLNQEKAQEASQVFNNELKNSKLNQQQISKEYQFQQGVMDQLKQNQQQIQEIDQQLQQNVYTTADGVKKRLISEEQELDLKTKKQEIEKSNLALAQQQNEIQAKQQLDLAEIQATRKILDNQDPLKQQLQLVDAQIQAQTRLNQLNAGLSKPEERVQAERALVELQADRRDILKQISDRELAIQQADAEIAQANTILNTQATERNALASQEIKFLQEKQGIIERELQTAKEYGATEQEIKAIEVSRLQNAIDLQRAKEAAMARSAQQYEDEINRRGAEMGLSELDILNQQIQAKSEYIKKLQEEKASYDVIIAQQNELRDLQVEQQNLKKRESSDIFNKATGALGSQGAVPTINAPSEIGQKQLQDQQLETSMDAINKSFSELSQYNPALSDMIANVSNLGLAFHQMGEGAATGQQVAAQGMSTVASMLNMSSQQTISSIDDQIAAEKARDGKSEESLKKIQKLEAEKAQQQKKAQTQQIVMQTAMGITQALASLPPPISYAMAQTTALMGAAALKSQQTGSAIPSVAEASVPSLSLGERDNRVDVSKSASAGELSYIQGQNGVGNASNFKPRQVGNRQPQNHSVMVGENGPEVVSFDTPGTITAQNKANGGQAQQQPTNIQIYAMDSESFQQFLAKNSKAVTSTVEFSLNNEGKSLYG